MTFVTRSSAVSAQFIFRLHVVAMCGSSDDKPSRIAAAMASRHYKDGKNEENVMVVANYVPVARAAANGLHGAALVGTHSSCIGWDLDDAADRAGLLGFAIRRSDFDVETGDMTRLDWLGGYKRFVETDDGQVGEVSSNLAPFQRFRWNDYTVRADTAYQYEVFKVRGTPAAPTLDGDPIVFDVRASAEDPDPDDDRQIGVFVNRGVTAAKAYFDRFGDRPPAEVGPGAYGWLSRGLKESLLDFIGDSQSGETLHVAIYEFIDAEVADALVAARDAGVTVLIVFDAKPGKHSTEKNLEMIAHKGLQNEVIPRSVVNISHNKIVVRLVAGVPHSVWTGSSNFSENAFNFQTNTGLVIRHKPTVARFEEFFQTMATPGSTKASSKIANRALMTASDAMPDRIASRTFFSPVSANDILECGVDLIANAQHSVFVSAPFGTDRTLTDALLTNDAAVLEYGLVNATAKRKIRDLQRKHTRFFPPNKLERLVGERWDAKAFGAHKIHAKSIVVDPWSDNPKVLIGSANFSTASCRDNDENTLLIEGDGRLAAIIATEFMRMYDHYKSRFFLRILAEGNKAIRRENREREAQGLAPKPERAFDMHLKSDDSWNRTAFDPNAQSHKFRDRLVFCGDT